MFLTHGWYREQWWKEGYISEYYNCSGEDLSRVALNNVGVLLSEFPEDPNTVDTTNTVRQYFYNIQNRNNTNILYSPDSVRVHEFVPTISDERHYRT